MTYLGAKEFSWPKDVSGGLELIKKSNGPVQAQTVDTVSSLKGTLVKPMSLKVSFKGQSSWVEEESSRGSSRKVPGSPVPVTAAMPSMTSLILLRKT